MKNIERKKKAALIIVGIISLSVIIVWGCVMIFHNSDNDTKKITDRSITELESLKLHLSGMRITEEYEFKVDGEQTEISYYTMSYASGQEERILIKRTACGTQTVIDTLNKFDVIKWDGFHGKHPKGVLDGTMFNLSATLNGGQKLYADGSQNFPKHFHEFENWLYEVFKDCEKIT